MAGLNFALKAKNSSSDLFLIFEKQDDGTITPTITGKHEESLIQIDFDDLTESEAKDLAAYILMRASGEATV